MLHREQKPDQAGNTEILRELRRAFDALDELRSLTLSGRADFQSGRRALDLSAEIRGGALIVYDLTAGMADRPSAKKLNTAARKSAEEAVRLSETVYERSMKKITGL